MNRADLTAGDPDGDVLGCELLNIGANRLQEVEIVGTSAELVGVPHLPGTTALEAEEEARGEQPLAAFEAWRATVVDESATSPAAQQDSAWNGVGGETMLLRDESAGQPASDDSLAKLFSSVVEGERLFVGSTDILLDDEPVALLEIVALLIDDRLRVVWPCGSDLQRSFERAALLTDRAPDLGFLADFLLAPSNSEWPRADLLADAQVTSSASEVAEEAWLEADPRLRVLYTPRSIPASEMESFRPMAVMFHSNDDGSGGADIYSDVGISLSSSINFSTPVIVAAPIGEPLWIHVYSNDVDRKFQILDGTDEPDVLDVYIDADSVRVTEGSLSSVAERLSDTPESYRLDSDFTYRELFAP